PVQPVESEFCDDNGTLEALFPTISETEETSDTLCIMLVGLAAGGLKACKPKRRLEIRRDLFAKRSRLGNKFPVWVRKTANWLLAESQLGQSALIASRRGRLRTADYPDVSAGELDLEETAKNIQLVFERNMSKTPELHLPESVERVFKAAVRTFHLERPVGFASLSELQRTKSK
ncbi:MAG: hypothetical protein EBR09_17030, partial [Proteobacteria bacterium]|nr:hypothetical protein [Pseudomonadota bacterium]